MTIKRVNITYNLAKNKIMWVKIKRMLQSGFVNFWRNGSISISTVLMMFVALFVISSVLFVGALLTSTLNQIKDKVDVNIYFAVSFKIGVIPYSIIKYVKK